jgi:hypothetical protein
LTKVARWHFDEIISPEMPEIREYGEELDEKI